MGEERQAPEQAEAGWAEQEKLQALPPRSVRELQEQGVALVCALRASGLSLRDAVRQAAQQTGLPKNELYERAIGT